MVTTMKLKPKYKVFIVDDDNFNDLYKDIPGIKKGQLDDKLGFADPRTNEAFVRKTGVKSLDDSTIEHELQELLVKISPDEENGIRYKSAGALGRILGPVIGAVLTPVLGPGGPAIGAAISAGTQARSQAVKPEKFGTGFGGIAKAGALGGLGALAGGSALTGGIAGGTAAAPGFLSKAAGIGKGALLGTPAVTGVGTGGAGVGAAPAGVSTFTPATKGLLGRGGSFLGGGTAASKAAETSFRGATPATGFAAASLAPGVSPAIKAPTLGVPGAGGVSAPSVAAATPKTLIEKTGGFLSKPSNLLGATLTAGSLLPKTPQFEFPQQFTDLQSKLQQGGALSPLGEQARGELSGILSAQPNELFPEANQAFLDATFRDFDERFKRDKEALDARYNLAGVFGSGEHLAAVDLLEKQYTDLRADTTAQINQRNFELGRTQKYQAIQDSLGVDKNDMDALLGLTGLDVSLAAQIYNVKAADVEELRKSMGTLGSELLLRGSGLQQPAGITINTGGGLLGGL